jgi:hypothetical protein
MYNDLLPNNLPSYSVQRLLTTLFTRLSTWDTFTKYWNGNKRQHPEKDQGAAW